MKWYASVHFSPVLPCMTSFIDFLATWYGLMLHVSFASKQSCPGTLGMWIQAANTACLAGTISVNQFRVNQYSRLCNDFMLTHLSWALA